MSSSKAALIHRRLYRALLRASKPFTPPSPDAAVLSCLLHRSFIPLEVDESLARQDDEEEEALGMPGVRVEHQEDYITRASRSAPKRSDAHFLLFRRLLYDVFAEEKEQRESDNSQNNSPQQKKRVRCLQFPSHVKEQPFQLRDVIRREFRVPDQASSKEERFSGGFTLQARRDAAFLALRRLNEKLVWADQLEEEMPPPRPHQAAKYVSPLSISTSTPPSSYLKPGTFLVAHPHLTGFFRRTVIVILKHGRKESSKDGKNEEEKEDGKNEEEEEDGKNKEEKKDDFGTYGIVVNRVSLQESTGKNRTLADVMSVLPNELVAAFGSVPVKEGGPVHVPSIQMLHACSPPDGSNNKHPSLKEIGGTKLPSVVDSSEKVVYFQGDIMKAAEAVKTDQLDRDDVSFFIGASSWYPGQLEQEIQQGCWLPVNGPPEIGLSGVCEHEPTKENEPRPRADLWLSMMSSCGDDESKLAHLVAKASEDDEYGAACDEF